MLSLQTIARRASALALTATLFVPAFAPFGSVASASDATEPQARLQVVLKQVEIHDDNDGIFRGAGEMKLWPLISALSIW